MLNSDRKSTWRALLQRPEAVVLAAALVAVAAALAFIALADELHEGDLGSFDDRLLREARRIVRSSDSIPAAISFNVTALGSLPVLVLVVACVIGFLGLMRERKQALYVLVATAGGGLLSQGLKGLFERPRPTLVPRLVHVNSWSFPSGHALASAVVYLTLGALIAASIEQRTAKLYCLAVALCLTFIVGISRVALGVHYPTDVLGGWMAGLSWALACWAVFAVWQRRRGPGGP